MPCPAIAPAPRRIPAGISLPCGRGRRRFHASFRRVTAYTFWRLSFRQSSLCHIARVPPHTPPDAWARLPVSWHPAVPLTSRLQLNPHPPPPPLPSLPP